MNKSYTTITLQLAFRYMNVQGAFFGPLGGPGEGLRKRIMSDVILRHLNLIDLSLGETPAYFGKRHL